MAKHTQPPSGVSERQAREARLAEELRRNLHRRKEQSRARRSFAEVEGQSEGAGAGEADDGGETRGTD